MNIMKENRDPTSMTKDELLNEVESLRTSAERLKLSNVDRNRVEEHLEEIEKRFRSIFDSKMMGILFWDAAGNVMDCNDAFLEMTGYSRDDVVSGRLLWRKMTPPEFTDVDDNALRELLETGTCVPFEKEYIRKDGSVFPIELSIFLFQKDGEPDRMWGIVREITERKQMEKTQLCGQAQALSILEAFPDGAYIVNQQFDIEYINPVIRGQFGPINGRKCYEYFHDLTEVCPWCKNSDVFAGKSVRWEWRSLKNGRYYDLYDTPIKNLDGTISKLEFFQDITDRKKAEEGLEEYRDHLEELVNERTGELGEKVKELKTAKEGLNLRAMQLENANMELETFSYSVAHDLRAPLRSINGFSQVLLEDYGDKLDAKGNEYLDRVRMASQRMATLIDDLLGLSHVTRKEMKRDSVSLSQIADSIATALHELEPERIVDFVIQPEITVVGDSHLLRIVLEKLMENAWKFTGKNPQARIEFGAVELGGEHTYFVRDDGVGFDQKHAEKLFKAFQRLHSREEFTGTGIGMATVHRIVHRHGGRVWGEGEVDKGATFYFTLV
jgi:PAS domain S-box-containing protein